MPNLAFIINDSTSPIDIPKIISTASEIGFQLVPSKPEPGEESEADITTFDVSFGGTLFVMPMPIPHPDVEGMPMGPLSPEDIDALIKAPSHVIVTWMQTEAADGDVQAEVQLAALTAAVMGGCKPVGVLKMPGVMFHRPELFDAEARQGFETGELPVLISIDVTSARESETHLSLLTHGMVRFGREDLYVTAPIEGSDCVGFTFDIMMWLISEPDYQLPTGDTVGRTADEKVKVQRVSNPTGEGPDVIRLDL